MGFVLMIGACAAQAQTVSVDVRGVQVAMGTVRCALFASPEGFPDDPSQQRLQIVSAADESIVCRFDEVPAGRIALAVSHDANDNGKLDSNFLGMPKEAWGVSRGARPSLRAPRFEEAAIDHDGQVLNLTIEVER